MCRKFFSPSGYEVVKDKSWADIVFYLPLDTSLNAKELIKALHPSCAIFVKYDFWFHLLNELSKNKIQTIFISYSLYTYIIYTFLTFLIKTG
ncbi:hypothetical protein ETU08_04875 [Apibacter muscae]|nr:hypothetical protein ETU08_04875 [Apibacter muscae]